MKYCPWCGASRVDDAAFCVECGRDLFTSQRPGFRLDPPDTFAEDKQDASPAMPGDQAVITEETAEHTKIEPRTIEKEAAAPDGKKRRGRNRPVAPAIEEEPDCDEDDGYDDQARFSYYDDVVPINENDRSDRVDKRVVMKIAVIGCVVLAVIALSVMAMLYL